MSKKSNKLDLSKLMFWKKQKKAADPTDGEPTAPRITSDTVAEHREEVLAGARRFIYPLQHSRHRVVIISSLIVAFVLIGALVFSGLMLYRYQSTSSFAYRVSQLVPYPISRVDGSFIPYEDYLFELNYSLFYYENNDQEGVDINSSEGEQVIEQLKIQALEKVKLDKIAKQLAADADVTVTDDQVNRQIELIRNNGGIGDSDRVLEEILRSSYNWGVSDLERTIRLQLVRQSLPRLLDTATIERAEEARDKLNNGSTFENIVKFYSDDLLTKDSDTPGVIGKISRTDTFLPPEFIEAAFALEAGETSELVESRFGLHIIRINEVDGDEREVAHTLFSYFDIDEFLRTELDKVEVVDYITIE